MKILTKIAFLITSCGILLFACQKNTAKGTKIITKPDRSYVLFDFIVENGDTIFDGIFFVYTKDGKLKRRGTLNRNRFYGNYEDFDNSGKIAAKRFRKNGKDVGEATWYGIEGNPRTYIFYDDMNNVNFVAKFDERGNVLNADGLFLLEVNQFKLRKKNNTVHYNVGDSVVYEFMMPNIPNTTKNFSYRLKDFDNSKINRTSKIIEPVTLRVLELAVKRGKNTIEAKVEYKFNDDTKIVIRDSLSFDFYVE